MSNSSIRIGTSVTHSPGTKDDLRHLSGMSILSRLMQVIIDLPLESWVNTWSASAPQDFTFSIK
jgi:hypothetical protein